MDHKGMVVTYQEKAWMDEDMKQWITKVWVQYTKKRPSLLVLDSFSAHLTEESKLCLLAVTPQSLSFQVAAP